MSSSHHNIQGRWDTALAREWGWNQWTPPSRPSPRETLLQACTLSLPALCCCLVAKSHLTLCNPMDCSKPGFPVLHCLPEFAQTHVHWVSDAIQPSHLLLIPSPFCLQSFPASGSFPVRQFFASGGQSIGASASVLPMNSQAWVSLGVTDLIFVLSKGLSRVFSSTTVWKHQFSPCSMASKLKDPRKDYKAPKIPRPWQ